MLTQEVYVSLTVQDNIFKTIMTTHALNAHLDVKHAK